MTKDPSKVIVPSKQCLFRLSLVLALSSSLVSSFSQTSSSRFGRRRSASLMVPLLQAQQSAQFAEAVAEPPSSLSLDQEKSVVPVIPAVQTVHCMPPPLSSTQLRNKYYLLRHGQSTANVAEIISSDAKTLAYSEKHGLTATGYQQGKASASQLMDLLETTTVSEQKEQVIFISSPFARASQTTKACLEGLLLESKRVKKMGLLIDNNIVIHDHLVERYFGRLDGQAIYTYAYVWPLDKFNVLHTAFDVESVAAVATRLHSLITQLEAQYQNCHLVMVGHADVLQIAQLYASGAENVGEFSSFRFQNGEVRQMNVGTTLHLPNPAPLEAPQRGTFEYTSSRSSVTTSPIIPK